jgi:hypothetical protein
MRRGTKNFVPTENRETLAVTQMKKSDTRPNRLNVGVGQIRFSKISMRAHVRHIGFAK